MKAHWLYLQYVLCHKWFVFLACIELGVPLWMAVLHDWDKFLPDEWFPYAEYFYGNKRSTEWFDLKARYGLAELAPWGTAIKDRFDFAWLLHQKRNKHHWQWWILTNDTDGTYPLPMPEVYIREMVADWRGAGLALGKPDTPAWYDKNKDKMCLHPETRERVESLLGEGRSRQ